MDKGKQAIRIIRSLTRMKNWEIKDYEFIKEVCLFFDEIKKEKLSNSDLQFLLYIANLSWIPHYFDFLKKFQNSDDLILQNINLLSFWSLVYDASLYVDSVQKLHKFQKEVLNRFSYEQKNRFFLSASTSFWKTFLVYEIMRKMNYKNIVLIFPTIALLSENYERILSDKNYNFLKQKYKIHTLSDISQKEIGEHNIFIFTPERFLSFLDQSSIPIVFDFCLIDEAYKLDNQYLEEGEMAENERDTAYRLSIYWFLKQNSHADFLMTWPYIDFDKNCSNSFFHFIQKNNIEILDYNHYLIVQKKVFDVCKQFTNEEKASWPKKNNRTLKQFWPVLEQIASMNHWEWTICFCPSRLHAENLVFWLLHFEKFHNNFDKTDSEFQRFLVHLEKNYNYNGDVWILIQWLKNWIGIHHGLIPKYIQKELIYFFNKWTIKLLFCTTTITEWVNTSAKNIVIYKAKKWEKILKAFDAKNIEWRAWRFWYHYAWNVYVLDSSFNQIKENYEEIEHKNYDDIKQKDNIDLFITDDEYLNRTNLLDRSKIEEEFIKRGISINVINLYKSIDPLIKIKIFDLICALSDEDIMRLYDAFKRFNELILDKDFVQILLIIKQVIPTSFNFYFDSPKGKELPRVYWMIVAYLRGWFRGSVEYQINILKKDINESIRNTAKFVYNVLKYQIVKYIGVFNIMFKIVIEQKTGKALEEIVGLEKLLRMLEYNAISDDGRRASDYWCPQKIIEFYDSKAIAKKLQIRRSFDEYEKSFFFKVKKFIW